MGLDKLKEQYLRQRQDFAPTDLVGMIADVLKLPPEDVARVLVAHDAMLEETCLIPPFHDRWQMGSSVIVSSEVEASIEMAMRRAYKRAWAARHLESGKPLVVRTQDLVGDKAALICNGCPDQLRCMADSLSTPEDCVSNHRMAVPVTVLLIKGDTVRVHAEQPRGEFTLSYEQIYWSLVYRPDPFGGPK